MGPPRIDFNTEKSLKRLSPFRCGKKSGKTSTLQLQPQRGDQQAAGSDLPTSIDLTAPRRAQTPPGSLGSSPRKGTIQLQRAELAIFTTRTSRKKFRKRTKKKWGEEQMNHDYNSFEASKSKADRHARHGGAARSRRATANSSARSAAKISRPPTESLLESGIRCPSGKIATI
jgi:hypothetical protein